MRQSQLLPGLALLGLAACVTTSRTAPAQEPGEVIWRSDVAAVWEARVRGAAVGRVVRLGSSEGERYFVVQNVHGQDLGLIDGQGRAWRARPHAEHEAVGTGTVADGAARILGEETVELLEVAAEAPSRAPLRP